MGEPLICIDYGSALRVGIGRDSVDEGRLWMEDGKVPRWLGLPY